MNQNYNFVRGLFSQVSNARNEELATKKGTSFKSLLLLVVFALFAGISMQGQTYFSESFEGAWYLNGDITTPATDAGPNAPQGWNQKRMTVDLVPAACVGGSHDWSQSTWSSGTVWSSSSSFPTGCTPYGGPPTVPPAGTKALWFYDGNTSGTVTRLIYSPVVNLSTSIAPVFSCSFSYAANSTSVTVVGSIDGGVTWTSFGALAATASGVWSTRAVAIPTAFRVANARIGLQMVSTYGSYDVFVDNVQIREGVSGTATAIGGLWSNTTTWVGGVLPELTATIPSGSIVTVDQSVTVSALNIAGTLQWNATTNAMTVGGNLTINSGGKFLPYITGGTGQTINIAGNFQNNGYANLALISTALNFNGSGSTLSGTGIFEGDGTRGIIRTLAFQNLGSNSITTTQNLTLTSGLTHTGGSLNTNGKIKIDNTAQIYGQALNLQVANLAVTNMGSLYTVAPVVFGQAVVPYANALAAVLGTRYFNGNDVFLCTTAGTFNATAPTSTAATTFTTSGPTLIWIGTLGTLGTNVPYNGALSLTTQYFYGDNVYQAILATATTTMPVHTSGTVGQFRYLGPAPKATVNFDLVTGTVRSLNLTQAGSGFSTAPAVAISRGLGDTTGTAAAATAVLFQQIIGPANSLTQKSGGAATITGGLTINSDQGASIASTNVQASSGVGNISTTNGGLNYTVAPLVGFAGPPTLNLVTNAGSGYTVAPTVTVTGGTLVSGTALATANFTITMNQGKVVSVYLNTATTATYSVPPTLAFSAGNATLAFPAGCWPAATANMGSNGQLTSFTMTNAGFGYAAAPIVGVGITTATPAGGTFTTVATAPTARIALYNLTSSWLTPAVAAVVATDDAAIPSNRKMNTLTLSGAGMGLNLTNNLTLFGTAPLSLTASASTPGNVINLGGFNLLFTWNAYAGSTASTFGATNTYIKNGSMTLTGRGGGTSGSTFNFPFSGLVTVFTGGAGSTAVIAGTDILTVKVTEAAAPTNTITGGTGLATGTRSFKVETASTLGSVPTSAAIAATNPTVKLSFNASDALTTTQDQTLISEGTSLNGPWNVRSAAIGASGALAATGTATTSITTPGPIDFTSGNFYIWSASVPTIAGVIPTVLCANSGAFTITGTNLTGVTAVAIGGTPVLSFTIVSPTSITGFAGNGTNGFISVTKNGITTTGIENITVNPSPSTPTVSTSAVSVNLGGTVTVTASGGTGTFKWYDAVSGGTLLFTGATYSGPVCSGNLWVAQNNGTCEGLRAMVTITTAPTTISSSASSFCGAGSPITLTAAPADASIVYSWTSLTPTSTVNSPTGANTLTSSLSETSEFNLTATKGACTASANISIGVYPLPTATVTTTAQGVCPGTSATIGSGLSAGNFTAVCIPAPSTIITPPSNAIALVGGGALILPLPTGVTVNSTTNTDDNFWGNVPVGFNFNFFGATVTSVFIGTNGTINLGATGSTTFSFPGGFPNAANPASTVAVAARDLRWDFGGKILYWTEGFAPNRRFVVQFVNGSPYTNSLTDLSGNQTAEAVFYETLGTIDIRVFEAKNTTTAALTSSSVIKYIGLQDGTRTIGATAPNCSVTPATPSYWNGQTAAISSSAPMAWRFTPPSNYTTTWFANGLPMPSVTANPTAVPPVVGYTNPGTNVFSIPVAPAATTTYSITYVNQTTGCSNAAGSAQVLMAVLGNVAPTGVNTISSASPICSFGDTVNLSLSYTGSLDGLVFQWQSSTNGTTWTDITGFIATTCSVIPTVATQYRCKIVACNGTPAFSNPVSLNFANSVVSTTPNTRCGTGTTTLGATGNAGTSINWYATLTGGTALGSGTTFTTPTIAATTTYYAEALTGLGSGYAGAAGPATTTNGTSVGSHGIMIATTAQNVNIATVDIPFTGTGTFTIALKDVTNTTVISSVTTASVTGNGLTPVTVPLNLVVPAAGSYSLIVTAVSGTIGALGYSTTTYPYSTLGGVFTVTSGYWYGTDAATNMYFYNLNVSSGCSSQRVAVVATVTTPPAFTLSGNPATICSEQTTAPVTVASGAGIYDRFVWSPSTGVSGNATTGWVFNPLTTTAYTLTVSQSTGATPCSTTANITVTVNTTPSIVTLSPTPAFVCVNTVLPLVATGGTVGSTGAIKIGSDVLTNTTSTPYKVFWGGSKTQALYTASELSALGLIGGSSISSIGHVILSGTPLLMNNYSVNVGFVSDTTLGTAFIAGANNSVLNNVAFTPSTGAGNIDYTLTTPIVWDGVSNLLVETCFNNNDGGGSSANSLSVESSTVASGLNIYRTQDNTVDVCSNATTPSTTTSRPNLRISVLGQVATTWTPIANLFTDVAATTPYTSGTSASTVYFKSGTAAPAVTYTASATSIAGCVRTATVPVTVRANTTLVLTSANATQTVCVGTAIANIVYTLTNGTAVTATLPAGLTGNLVGNTYTISGIPTAPGAVSVTGTGLCLSSAALTGSISINPNTTLALGSGTPIQTVCYGIAISNIVYTVTNGTGVTATLPAGLIGTYAGGTYTISGTPTASGTISVSGTGLCLASAALTGVITVNQTFAPVASAAQSVCYASTIANLTVTATLPQWYAASTGGTALASTTPLVNGTIYYVSQTLLGCEGPRAAVTVTIITTPAPTGLQFYQFCPSGNATLNDITATLVGTAIKWYAAPSGGTQLPSTTALAQGYYWASQTANGCESPTRFPVFAISNATAAPSSNPLQQFCISATVSSLTANGSGLQWYAASTGGVALASTASIATGTYYVSQTSGGCESPRTAVAVIVTVVPNPTATAQTFCNSGTVAGLTATGSGLNWYSTSTGGTALASTTALASGTYYVSQTVNGCEGSRTSVVVTINTTLAPTATAQTFCNSGTVAALTATGTALNWYASLTGGAALANTTALATGTYYVSQTINTCEGPRTAVSVTVNTTSAPNAAATQTFCNSATVAALTATGTGLNWYATATGGTALTSTTALTTGTTYYVSQTISGCQGPRTAVSVIINSTPAPTGAATQSLSSLLTVGNIVVAGTNVVWYSSSANAASGTNPLPNTTLLANTTYYATQTIAGCASTTSLAVTITTLANQDFDMTKFSYYPNPVIDLLNVSYSQDMTNIKVFNMIGQQLLNKDVNATSTQIDMSSYANGAYFIQVSTENAMKTVRVIKK